MIQKEIFSQYNDLQHGLVGEEALMVIDKGQITIYRVLTTSAPLESTSIRHFPSQLEARPRDIPTIIGTVRAAIVFESPVRQTAKRLQLGRT